MADYLFLLETRLNPGQQAVVGYLQQFCQKAGVNLYLTGGPMRDLLAGTPIRTLDFTTEGNPLKFQKALAADGVEILYADAEEVSLRLRFHRVRFRITAAQSATWDKAGKPPKVRPGTIIEDLRRRGFTLNAVGLSLNPASRGLLLDPTNGVSDIEHRLIRMTHNYIFLDDPIRLLRVIRLKARLGFEIEERTAMRMESAREGDYLGNASAPSLGRELEALAYEPDPGVVLKEIEKEGFLEAAFGKGVKTAKMDLAGMARMPKAIELLDQVGIIADSGPVALHFMLAGLPPKDRNRVSKLPLSRPLVESWQHLDRMLATFDKEMTAKNVTNLAAVEAVVRHTPSEALLFALVQTGASRAVKKLKEYLAQVPEVKAMLPVRELQQLGGEPGTPVFQAILNDLYQRLLIGKLKTPEEVSQALKEHVETAGIRPAPVEEKPSAKGRGPGRPGRRPKTAY